MLGKDKDTKQWWLQNKNDLNQILISSKILVTCSGPQSTKRVDVNLEKYQRMTNTVKPRD